MASLLFLTVTPYIPASLLVSDVPDLDAVYGAPAVVDILLSCCFHCCWRFFCCWRPCCGFRPYFALIHAVVGVSAFAGVSAVEGVFAVDGVPAIFSLQTKKHFYLFPSLKKSWLPAPLLLC
jgi:hypothetical protein